MDWQMETTRTARAVNLSHRGITIKVGYFNLEINKSLLAFRDIKV